jgi:hypothetical protein
MRFYKENKYNPIYFEKNEVKTNLIIDYDNDGYNEYMKYYALKNI